MAGRIRVFTQRNGVAARVMARVAARVTARAAARRSPRDAVAENADPFTTAVQVTIARLQRKLGRPPSSTPPRASGTGSQVRLCALSRTLIPRLITTSSVVGATTAFRVGAGCARLLRHRSGPLVSLAVRASFGADTQTAEATLRDEVVALARDSAELSWRELRRGVDALDSYTRPVDRPRSDQARRPYRVKS
jgi:hypothetical protein